MFARRDILSDAYDDGEREFVSLLFDVPCFCVTTCLPVSHLVVLGDESEVQRLTDLALWKRAFNSLYFKTTPYFGQLFLSLTICEMMELDVVTPS